MLGMELIAFLCYWGGAYGREPLSIYLICGSGLDGQCLPYV
ncbi:hypothetical protein AMTRI_Chr02g264160 [Amborella trichopoda]